MIIDKLLLDKLSEEARNNPRLRQHFDLRNTPEDRSQRILNAMEPGTIMPIHRHNNSTETIVMLRGKGRWNYYDTSGELTESYIVEAGGTIYGLSIPKGQWHNSEILEEGTIILETKDGAWKPLEDKDILNIN